MSIENALNVDMVGPEVVGATEAISDFNAQQYIRRASPLVMSVSLGGF